MFRVPNPLGIVLGTRRAIRHGLQRLSRGWDDSATWSLDVHLARTLSDQLDHLADTTHGYPTPYETFDEWRRTLKEKAEDLRYYAAEIFGENAEDAHRRGTSAMHWVADNLADLWD